MTLPSEDDPVTDTMKPVQAYEGHDGNLVRGKEAAIAEIIGEATWGDVRSAMGQNQDINIIRLRVAILEAAAIIRTTSKRRSR